MTRIEKWHNISTDARACRQRKDLLFFRFRKSNILTSTAFLCGPLSDNAPGLRHNAKINKSFYNNTGNNLILNN